MTKALLYTLERPAPHTLTAAAGSQRPRRALRDSFARPAAPTRQLEDLLGAAAEEEVVISTSFPCSSLAMRRHGVRVNSNLRYPKNGNWGGFSAWWGITTDLKYR